MIKRIRSRIYERTKKEIEQDNKECCQDVIITIRIVSNIKIEHFDPYDPTDPYDPYNPAPLDDLFKPSPGGEDILGKNPDYIPPIRPLYPLR